MNDSAYVKRTDWPKNTNCARCGESIETHQMRGGFCSLTAVRRVIGSGRTYSEPMIGGPHEVTNQYHSEPDRDPRQR